MRQNLIISSLIASLLVAVLTQTSSGLDPVNTGSIGVRVVPQPSPIKFEGYINRLGWHPANSKLYCWFAIERFPELEIGSSTYLDVIQSITRTDNDQEFGPRLYRSANGLTIELDARELRSAHSEEIGLFSWFARMFEEVTVPFSLPDLHQPVVIISENSGIRWSGNIVVPSLSNHAGDFIAIDYSEWWPPVTDSTRIFVVGQTLDMPGKWRRMADDPKNLSGLEGMFDPVKSLSKFSC